MNGSTHMTIGFLAGTVVALHFDIPLFLPTVAVLVVSVLGAVLPDIDHPSSWISNRVGLLGWPFRFFSHRGFTHSILGTLVFAQLVYELDTPAPIAAALLLSYISHLLADSMTRAGIRLLYPLHIRCGLPRPLAVGARLEGVIGVLAITASAWLFNQHL